MTTATVDVRVTRARSALIMRHAFFGSLAMRLRAVERNDISTMATDGKHLFYSLKFLNEITDDITTFVVAHEVLHCALGHHTRRNGRDPLLWNKACDYVVNLMLRAAGFNIPSWVLIDDAYIGLNADQVYRLLDQQKDSDPPLSDEDSDDKEKDEDEDSDGDDAAENDTDDESSDDQSEDQSDGDEADDASEDHDDGADNDGEESYKDENTSDEDTGETDQEGDDTDGETDQDGGDKDDGDQGDADDADDGKGDTAGGKGDAKEEGHPAAHGDPGGCGEVLDAAPEHDKAALAEAQDEWEVFARQATNIARKQGNLPGFIQEMVDQLDTPRVDWRDVLRRFVDPSNTKDYSWVNVNRRYTPFGWFTPGVVQDGVNHVVLLIDTSGSIDRDALRRFGGECQSALDDGAVDKVTVIMIDTQVNQVAEFVRGDKIDFTVKGGGGTLFSPGFAWINENAPDVSAAIYFTDLECGDFGDAPSYPVLWAAYGNDPRQVKRLMDRVPFGECVELVN